MSRVSGWYPGLDTMLALWGHLWMTSSQDKDADYELKAQSVVYQAALEKTFFQNGGGKNDIKMTKSGQGKVLRPEIERSDQPEARQNSGFGWRGHKSSKNQSIVENPKFQ